MEQNYSKSKGIIDGLGNAVQVMGTLAVGYDEDLLPQKVWSYMKQVGDQC